MAALLPRVDMRADHQLEGIVSKLASSKYRSGHSKTWLKTKCFTESSFLIIGTARDRKTKAALLGRRQFNWLLASAPSPPIAFNAADKTLTVVVDFDQRLMTLFAVTRQHAPAQRASGANGVPNTRADTGGPGTGPSPAAPKPTEASGPIGTARASHGIHPDLPRGGNAPDQLNRVMSERGSERGSTSRINSAPAYSNVNRDFSAMAAGGHGEHAPVSVEVGR
jgi:hypothetical protein